MKNPKLIDGLKMLEKEEWISFRKYILMYCTKSSDHYQLLDYLFSVRNKLDELSEIEALKKPLFQKMSIKSFSNLMSRVYKWFEEWLVWHEMKKDSTASDIQLVKIFNRRGVYSLADKTYRRVEQVLLQEDSLDLRRHKDLYQLNYNLFFSDNQVKYKRGDEILDSLVSYFLLHFREQALLYKAEFYNWSEIRNHDYGKEIELLSQFIALIPNSKTSTVLEYIVTMVSDMDAKAFKKLQKVIYSGQLKQNSELYIICVFYMVGFSLRLWNNNKISDSQIVIDAYDFGLESGVLMSSGKIPILRFFNLVTTLGIIKTSTRTYDFVDKWIPNVDTNDHDAIKALSYAQLKYIEKKYQEIVPLLLGKKFESEFGKLRAISLEVISLYYDREANYNLLINRINNFKRILRTYSHNKSTSTSRGYLNFAKVLELLIKRDFAKININVDKYSPLMHKRWLISEIKAGQN